MEPATCAQLGDALERRLPDQPADWPDLDARPLLEQLHRFLERDPGLAPWGLWIVRDEAGVIAGDAGFKGPPDRDGLVELSYYLRPVHRGRGLMTEAVRALCDWAFEHGASILRAEVHESNAPSEALLRRCGFLKLTSADGYAWFERTLTQRPRVRGSMI